jgi:hypothetical protein
MPFAEIVEAQVVLAGSHKKLFKVFLVVFRVANETGLRSAGALNRDVDNTKQLPAQVFPHQQSADFPATGTPELMA